MKPRIRVPYRRAAEPERESLRVCVIGDLHVCPGQDLTRLKLIARHIGETQPDRIVQIGDWADFDSVSTHDPLGSIKANNRPTLAQDIYSLEDSLTVFDRELGPSAIPRDVTLGNHEDRVRKYEHMRAELEDSVWLNVLNAFARFRWQTHDFGKVIFLGGVGFVHVPLNVMGKPYGSPNIVLNDLTYDLVRGHSHKINYVGKSKIGHNNKVSMYDVGTSYINGQIKDYAKLGVTGWWYGIHDMTIRDGRVEDINRISMRTLEESYS
jgi:hypothetical protein